MGALLGHANAPPREPCGVSERSARIDAPAEECTGSQGQRHPRVRRPTARPSQGSCPESSPLCHRLVGTRPPPVLRRLSSAAVAAGPRVITLQTDSRPWLGSVKRQGESYDALIRELTEEYHPPRVLAESWRRVARIRVGRVQIVSTDVVHRRWPVGANFR